MVRKRKAEHEASREIAVANGEEIYVGSRCRRGHDGRRYVEKMHGICVTCYKENQEAIMLKYRARKADPKYRAEKLFHRAKKRAAENGREFTITRDDIIIPSHCPISGLPIGINLGEAEGLSLDRIDNSKGYILGNVAVISHRMNTLKSSTTIAEVEALLAYMKRGDIVSKLLD